MRLSPGKNGALRGEIADDAGQLGDVVIAFPSAFDRTTAVNGRPHGPQRATSQQSLSDDFARARSVRPWRLSWDS